MQNEQPQQSDRLMQKQQTTIVLNNRELQRVSNFIGAEIGIQLPSSKHTLVEGRLRKRLRTLGFTDFTSYLDHALDGSECESERLHLIDAITTNKTDFFREPEHFDYLMQHALPEMEKNREINGRRELNLWSAGCSSGEEPYTLAIVMHEAAEKISGMRFNILGTDISQSCLQTAARGVYTENRVEPVPLKLRQKYFLRSLDPADELVQMGDELRSRVNFASLNLMSRVFNINYKMDVIFCRNVMIYFNNEIRKELIDRFENSLLPGGYLFVGHSESINGISSRFKQVAPMVYQKQQ